MNSTIILSIVEGVTEESVILYYEDKIKSKTNFDELIIKCLHGVKNTKIFEVIVEQEIWTMNYKDSKNNLLNCLKNSKLDKNSYDEINDNFDTYHKLIIMLDLDLNSKNHNNNKLQSLFNSHDPLDSKNKIHVIFCENEFENYLEINSPLKSKKKASSHFKKNKPNTKIEEIFDTFSDIISKTNN